MIAQHHFDESEFYIKLFLPDNNYSKEYYLNLYYFWTEAIKIRTFHTEF